MTGQQDNVQHILVVEAVDTTAAEATVGTVAHQLGLDHSGASRMVRVAVVAGYLARGESEHDRRRVCLRLTPSGHELLAGSHEWQRGVFQELTQGWDQRDRDQFATCLRRPAREVGA